MSINEDEKVDQLPCGTIGNASEHICTYPSTDHPGWVTIHPNSGCMLLTPEQALLFANSIIKAAEQAAGEEIKQ